MAKQGITTGTTPNDGTGDTLLSGAVKINSNFDEIYDYFGNGSNLNFTSAVWPQNDTGIHTTRKVGIGTTTASEQLTVSGNISVPDDNYSYYGSSNDLKIRHNTALGNEISLLNDHPLFFNDGNVVNTWLKIDKNGSLFSPAGITSVGAAVTFKGTDGSVLARNLKITGVTTSGSFVAGSDVTAAGKILGVGSITGATIHGSGAALSNIVTSVTAGAGVTVSASTGGITISSASGGAQGYFQKNATGINTSSNVGIGNTNATSALTVSGHGKFTGIVTATTFVGNLTGQASALSGSRTIGGVVFDNTGNINLPGVNQSGTQNTSGTAGGLTGTPDITVGAITASNVNVSGITTVGILTAYESITVKVGTGSTELTTALSAKASTGKAIAMAMVFGF